MSAAIDAEPTEEHITNHKAYVQSWLSEIRKDPDILVKAIKEAQDAASYMDWKAELISEQEYGKIRGTAFEVSRDLVAKDEKEMEAVTVAPESMESEFELQL